MLDVEDEYDVQYLLGFLLRCLYNDVRPEEPTPSSGGASARGDFLLKEERVIVEAKMSRPSLDDKKLGEEIATDVVRYRVHPNCDSLVVLVYDPQRQFVNPRALAADLTRPDDSPAVYVFVSH